MEKSVEELKREIFDNPNKETVGSISGVSPELLRMFPSEKIDRIKKKELRKYSAAQDKKWQNYLESMSR